MSGTEAGTAALSAEEKRRKLAELLQLARVVAGISMPHNDIVIHDNFSSDQQRVEAFHNDPILQANYLLGL